MRPLRAAATVAVWLLLSGQAALACGAMVSEHGRAEVTGFEALLSWDGSTERLLVSVDFQTADPTFAWLMPFPAPPEIEESDLGLIEEAFEITEPPIREQDRGGEGAGAGPPTVGGGVEVLGRDTVGGLRFVTLDSTRATQVARWMQKHGFGFHDRQGPVLASYLAKGWVVVAARVAPGETLTGALTPIRFTFPSPEPTYPLAMAGSGHGELAAGMTLFTLTPYRPTSRTYPERIVRPSPDTGFAPAGPQLELRYSAQLGEDAERMDATPETWLTRYETNIPTRALTEDLVLVPAAEQVAVDYSELGDELGTDGTLVWLLRIAVVLAAALLAIWISVGMARRRRASESARMPGQGPGV